MANTYNPLQYSKVQGPTPNPQLQNFQNATGNESVASLQNTQASNPNLNMGDMSARVGSALTSLQNYADPNQMRDTALSFYSKPINEQYDKAAQQQQNYFQGSGFGNSSAKVLADMELAKNRSADLQSAAERAQLNSWQYAPNLMQAYGQQAQNLANLAYTPMQQNLQAQNIYGNQFLNAQQNEMQRQQLAQQAQQANQTAGLESNRLGAQIDYQSALQQLQRDQYNAEEQQRAYNNVYRNNMFAAEQDQFDRNYGLRENELQGKFNLDAAQIQAQLEMKQLEEAQKAAYNEYLANLANKQAQQAAEKIRIENTQNANQ